MLLIAPPGADAATRHARAYGALPAQVRSELQLKTRQLSELTRRDVEDISVDDDDIIVVPLTKTSADGTAYNSQGALVPFQAEGQGGGNVFQVYAALFVLVTREQRKFANFLQPERRHPHAGLLAFAPIDNRGPIVVRWREAVVTEGLVTVPADIPGCDGFHGSVAIHVDNDPIGPHIHLVFDANSTPGPATCVR